MRGKFLFAFIGVAALLYSTLSTNAAPDHVVIVIMENHSFGQIIGSAQAPNINALAASGANIINSPDDPQAARSGSHAERHPSQPNYLELYSGDSQGTISDGRPGTSSDPLTSPPPFTTPNLGAALRNAGYSFATYSQTMPSVGFDGDSFGGSPGYQRKHNPVANWMNATNPTANQLPPSVNQPFTAFEAIAASPGSFANLPTVSFVVPDQLNDMHDGTIQQADTWLKTNIIDTYLVWAMTHNSLLILTFDEDATNTPTNQIVTIFAGPMIEPGDYAETDLNINNPHVGTPTSPGIQTPTGTAMNHYNLLSTIEDFYGLAHIGGSIDRPPVSDIFRPVPVPVELTGFASRKIHGANSFDVTSPLVGNPGIECRSGGANGDHTLVFIFADALTNVDDATVTSGTGTVSSQGIGSDAHEYIVNVTGVSNAQTITITLVNVNDDAGHSSSSVSASIAMLAGDTNADGGVNSGDIAQTKSQSGKAVTTSNFREDLTVDGSINSGDIAFVKSKSGTALP